jgi:GR25 family glycosyltransferase involved in LPS biosynthesis
MLSHLKALHQAYKDKVDYAVIFEDDFKFNKKIKFKSLLKYITKINFDVCLLDANREILKTKYMNYLYKVNNAHQAGGYIIKRHYIPILVNFWNNTNLGEFKNINYKKLRIKYGSYCTNKPYCPYTQAIDQSWKKLQKKDNWIIFYPKIGTQLQIYSDIEKRIAHGY